MTGWKIEYSIITVVAMATATMLAGRLFDYQSVEIPAKMMASSAFVVLALSARAWQTRYGRFILAGLAFSWIGDLLLTGSGESRFLLGLGSFLFAHVAYIAAFVSLGTDKRWALAAAAPIALLSGAVTIWLSPHIPAGLVIPVRVYTAVISLMVITSISARGAGAVLVIPSGALLFYFSDLSVAIGQFIETDFPNYLWGLPFYFGGQVLLALSIREPAQLTMTGLKTRIETASFQESIDFYSAHIGMTLLDSWNHDGNKGAILGLRPAVDGESFLELAYSETPTSYAGLSLQFRVRNIEAVADSLRGRLEFTGPKKRPWGSTYLYLQDPSGIQLILYEGKL